MIFTHTSRNHTPAGSVAGDRMAPTYAEKPLRRLTEALRSPMTVVFLVWAYLFAVASLYFTFIE